MYKINLSTDRTTLVAEIADTDISEKLFASLPFFSTINIWGEEIYFSMPEINTSGADLTEDVSVGDIAYWPEGNCLCVFWGKTPLSTGDNPVPASGVIVLGKITEGLEKIHNISEGENISVERSPLS